MRNVKYLVIRRSSIINLFYLNINKYLVIIRSTNIKLFYLNIKKCLEIILSRTTLKVGNHVTVQWFVYDIITSHHYL